MGVTIGAVGISECVEDREAPKAPCDRILRLFDVLETDEVWRMWRRFRLSSKSKDKGEAERRCGGELHSGPCATCGMFVAAASLTTAPSTQIIRKRGT